MMKQGFTWLAVALLLAGAHAGRAEDVAKIPEELLPPAHSSPVPAGILRVQTLPDMAPRANANKEKSGPAEKLPPPKKEGNNEEEPTPKTHEPIPPAPTCCQNVCPIAGRCQRFWQWLTYKPVAHCDACCCSKGCEPCGMPPLYLYFLCDRWGPWGGPACGHGVVGNCPTCGDCRK
jgi:hypothetical protein